VTAGVLESIQLPRLIKMNSQRLSEAYTRVTDWLKRHGLPFVPATGGVYVFARLAPYAQTWADEDEMIARLRAARVLVTFAGGSERLGAYCHRGGATYSNASFDADGIGAEAGY
jgi:hypothetical protein